MSRLRTLAAALVAAAAVLATQAPAASAVAVPGYFEGLTPEKQAAVRNAYSQLTRGEYISPKLQGTWYGEANGKAVADYIRSVPSTAPGGANLATGTGEAAVKAKFWPRLGQSALGIARSRGVLLAGRAFPAIGIGAYIVWKIGQAKQVVRISTEPVRATAERFVFTGADGPPVCVTKIVPGTGSQVFNDGSGEFNPPAGSSCPTVNTSTPTGAPAASGPALTVPGEALLVQMWNGSNWINATDCVSKSTGDYGFDYEGGGPQIGDNRPPCTMYTPPGEADYGKSFGQTTFDAIQAFTVSTSGPCAGETNCRVNRRYAYGLSAWFKTIPNGAGTMLDGPRLGDTSLTPDVESALPAMPSQGLTDGALADFLAADNPRADAHRKAIDQVLNEAPPEGDSIYTQETRPVINPSNTGPAYGGYSMPNCIGLSEAACRSALTNAGSTGDVNVTTATFTGADLDKPAGAIITQSPGATVNTSATSTITLTKNPDPLPVRIPAANPGETATAYTARLQQLGLVGQVTVLSDLATDPGFGPSEVVRTNPDPGTRVQTGTKVDVTANPTTAPPATGGLSSSCGLTPPSTALNLGPITSLNLGTVFPFSLVTVVVNALGDINVASARPNFTVTAFGNSVGDLSYLANFDGVFSAIRLALSFGLTIGAAMFLWRRTIGA